ncbi:MAG TPA: methionyl-tRNA formyltransferase, partial [Verrucomicrobiae bacterium]
QPVEGVSYAAKIKKQDGEIDWTQSARAIGNRVRALTPWPGAFTHLPAQPQSQLLKIWEAEPVETSGTPGEILQADKSGIVIGCGEGSLRVRTLQREGGRRMSAAEFLVGHPLTLGTRLQNPKPEKC